MSIHRIRFERTPRVNLIKWEFKAQAERLWDQAKSVEAMEPERAKTLRALAKESAAARLGPEKGSQFMKPTPKVGDTVWLGSPMRHKI